MGNVVRTAQLYDPSTRGSFYDIQNIHINSPVTFMVYQRFLYWVIYGLFLSKHLREINVLQF
jgi:hypothetical protein